MINNIMNILRSLNEGSVIPNQNDENTRVDLYDENTELYIDESGKKSKYYFFAEFYLDKEMNDNLSEIEKVLINNDIYTVIGEPRPSDSYLILFWKVNEINDSIYPYIIEIEENEFFFKKYVFYYTENELNSFEKWYIEMKSLGASSLTNLLEKLSNVGQDSDQMNFLTRILIKIPFLNPVFPKAIMNDFDKMVQKKIDMTRQKKDIEVINKIFVEAMNDVKLDLEAISNSIYDKLMED